MYFKPIEIANKLGVSTSALRHYESWGIVPPPKRNESGYRLYTEVHLAYFVCIRSMNSSFGMGLTKNVMIHLQRKEAEEALWLVTEAQATLYRDKKIAEKTVEILEEKVFGEVKVQDRKGTMLIGEIAKEAGVPTSAIRHWEGMGLITSERNEENGYRVYKYRHLQQILMIRTLRSANYSLEVIKPIIEEIDFKNLAHARQLSRSSLQYLNNLNRARLKGMHDLFSLCNILELAD